MSVTASISNYRQAPRKVRLLADLLRGKKVEEALLEVKHLDKRASVVVEKLIKSAVANAKSLGLATDDLYITEFCVDKGVVMKRSMPRAMGRAFPIMKRSSHIKVVLGEKGSKKATKKTKEVVEEKAAPEEKKVTAKKATGKKVAKKATK